MSSPRTSTRLLAALTSLALVGAGLVSLAHHVQTRHEVCAEHGEQIHVDADAGVIVEATTGAISNNPLDLDHGDHCAIAWSTSETTGDAQPGVTAAGELGPLAIVAPVERPVVAGLWLLAPKNSPPV